MKTNETTNLFKFLFIQATVSICFFPNVSISSATDSSTIVPPTSNPMMTVTVPTTTGLSQAAIETLLTKAANECKTNETRDYCWKRYRATLGTTAPSNTLECPDKYFAVTRFGKDAVDSAGNPITYYEQSLYQKVTRQQYAVLTQALMSTDLHFTCAGSTTQSLVYDWGSGTTCYYASEGARDKSFSGYLYDMPDGFLGINDDTATVTSGAEQDWTVWGAARCDRYTAGGCPAAWCSTTFKLGYAYRWVECKRPAGYWAPIDPTIARTYNLVIPAASTQYTPTIVICSKAKVIYEPVP